VAGIYERLLTVTSNDLDEPTILIPILFEVTGTSDITATPAALAFDDTYIGQSDTIELILVNDGPVSIDISGWTFSDSDFSVDVEYPN